MTGTRFCLLTLIRTLASLATCAQFGCAGRHCVLCDVDEPYREIATHQDSVTSNLVATFADAGRDPAQTQTHLCDQLGESLRVCIEAAAAEPLHYLALSGGGPNGAYGAGFLNGWSAVPATDPSARPKFHVVTGVSTGSLIATFAFLGSEYDALLEEVYTTVSDRDILRRRFPLCVLFSDSLATVEPLERLIEHYVTDEIIERVAQEGRAGRGLFVGAVNLDLGIFVPINLTEKAMNGEFDLYRKSILASAAIPVQFPPVEIGSFLYVDGGAREWIFFDQFEQAMRDSRAASKRQTVYLLVNHQIGVAYECVQRNIIDIGLRSVTVLADEALVGNLYRIYATKLERDFDPERDFQLLVTWIPSDECAGARGDGQFNTEFMRCLFRYGFEQGRRQDSWRDRPPGLSTASPHRRE